jgi:hypothetical protein
MMTDPYVRPVGDLTDLDGRKVVVGVDYDSVTISSSARLTWDQVLEFFSLFFAAGWEALENKRRMTAAATAAISKED